MTEEETLTTSPSTETTLLTRIHDVFRPDWSDSWLLGAAPVGEEEECHKNWNSCWGYSQQIRWCRASLQSQHRHSARLARRRKATSTLLTSLLDEELTDSTEWTDAWRIPKRWIEPEEEELEETQEEGEEEIMDDTEEEEGEVGGAGEQERGGRRSR
ncbi:hypothetical protein CesoFtcFv8_024717 [Champsocephalus esox]|nr:hypothetical protein CesoFtcFv8_024717 [Champsocephalus esox]